MEHNLAKVGVAGSSPVSRSSYEKDIQLDVLFCCLIFGLHPAGLVLVLGSASVVAVVFFALFCPVFAP